MFLLITYTNDAFYTYTLQKSDCSSDKRCSVNGQGGFGDVFGPVVLFSLFWKRTTLWGALAGMVSGGAMVFIWKYVIAGFGGVFAIYELLPAFLVSSILIIVVSLLTKKPSEDIVKEFELAKSKEKI